MKSVLVVDDSKMSRLMVTAIISGAFPDCVITVAESGDEALKKASGMSFDRIILDYNMPGMTGEQLAIKLREMYPDAKISLLTANLQDAVKQRAKEIKVGHIPKPITEEKIIEFLKAA